MIYYYKKNRNIQDRLVDGLLFGEKVLGKKVFNKDGSPSKFYLKQGKDYEVDPKIKEIFDLSEIDKNVYLMDSEKPGKVIIYVHGGAYWLQPLYFHYRMIHNIIKETGGVCIIPIYPKAPYATYKDVYAFIEPILDKYIKMVGLENIILMGDSAGGGFIISLGMKLEKENKESPRIIAISPWLNLNCTNNVYDPMLKADVLTKQGKIYADDLPLDSPLISPLFGDASKLKDVMIITGTHDILSKDAIAFEKKNPQVNVYVYPKRNHDFPLYPIGTGSNDAIQKIINKINE